MCYIFNNCYTLSLLILFCGTVSYSSFMLLYCQAVIRFGEQGYNSLLLISRSILPWCLAHNRCSVNVCGMTGLMNQQLLWSIPAGICVWLLLKKWKVCSGFGARPEVFLTRSGATYCQLLCELGERELDGICCRDTTLGGGRPALLQSYPCVQF